MNPRHPIYIVSKGRAATSLTARALVRTGVPFRVVVEEAELDEYAAKLGRERILVLDPEYQRTYDTCDELGLSKSVGPGAARNFAWDHSISEGAEWHWVMDDNIDGFFRLNRNLKTPVADGTVFRAMESFVERYENVAMAGPHYFMFAWRKSAGITPITLNSRVYSCNLIRNDTPYRWRGRYNEDTDLSLRMLKDGWTTVLFSAFLQLKLTTQTVAGGNHADFYEKEGTLPKSQMLVDLHPDVARLAFRFGRWHHFVDYGRFRRNLLRPRSDLEIPDGVDNFGMKLQHRVGGRWITEGEAVEEEAPEAVPDLLSEILDDDLWQRVAASPSRSEAGR